MSIANDILTDVLSKLSTQLGNTYRELPDLFDEGEASTRELDKGYSAILTSSDNGENQTTGFVTHTRQLVVKLSYRTFSRHDSSKTKTALATLYANEETLIPYFLRYPSKPAGLIGVVDVVGTDVNTLTGEDDDFLINTIIFNIVYRYAYS